MSIKKKKVLLVGDLILDVYVHGTYIGESLETPTIVAKEDKKEKFFGGSSLVARNLLELGAEVCYISVLGGDEESKHYDNFEHKNLKKNFILDKSRKTTVKKRFWVDGYKMLQFDNMDNKDIEEKIEKQVIDLFRKNIDWCDVVVVADYRHGMMTKKLISDMKKIAEENNKMIIVDSQVSHRESVHELYKDFYLVCLSEKEAKEIDSNYLPSLGLQSFDVLKSKLGKSNICVKLGEKGSISLIDGAVYENKAIKVDAKDTCGAGDAFLAMLSLGDFSSMNETLKLANVWAGLSTINVGPNPPDKKELLKYMDNLK